MARASEKVRFLPVIRQFLLNNCTLLDQWIFSVIDILVHCHGWNFSFCFYSLAASAYCRTYNYLFYCLTAYSYVQVLAWSNYSVSAEQFTDALSIAAQSKRAVRFIRWYVKLILSACERERERESGIMEDNGKLIIRRSIFIVPFFAGIQSLSPLHCSPKYFINKASFFPINFITVKFAYFRKFRRQLIGFMKKMWYILDSKWIETGDFQIHT